VDPEDRAVIEQTVKAVEACAPASADVARFAGEVLLDAASGVDRAARVAFAQRLQQVTGPATAKGVEDTALYVYVPLVSRNEVGGAPDRSLADAVARLHAANERRAERWPRALICTNTHDTKRSADVRARIDALSEVPQEWERCIRRWRRLNAKHRHAVKGRLAPDTNTEYLIYQTLIALWPPPRTGRRADDLPDRAWRTAARERLNQYVLKAAREAKLRTSWVDPDAAYEEALVAFVAGILEPHDDAPFLSDVARLVSRVAAAGAWNALSRVVAHLTAPGTPDIYQGDELWNFTLVDPDNRRQIDYQARGTALETLAALEQRLHDGAPADPFDAGLKLLVTQRLLETRRSNPDLFTRGGYRALAAHGARAPHLVAFAREHNGRHAITLMPRLMCSFQSPSSDWWGGTTVELPDALARRRWHSQIIPGEVVPQGNQMDLGAVFKTLPLAVLVS
jgi:(1->4)-alpha-D-glucan 1-alpha-D-glucosylmutase